MWEIIHLLVLYVGDNSLASVYEYVRDNSFASVYEYARDNSFASVICGR